MRDLTQLKESLAAFAERAAATSPLYAHLAERAATDDEVAALLDAAAEDAGGPALLLAAAHRLLQAEPIHPLQRYYPTLGGSDGPDLECWPLFRDFVLERSGRMRELISTHSAWTYDVQRAAPLYLGVADAAKRARGSIALLEVGAGAGFLLALDRYAFRYTCDGGEQYTAGPTKSAVGLHCAVEVSPGSVFPKPPKKLVIGARVGLDREPVDTGDEDQVAWLEACVWADQPDRARLLRSAAAAQAKNPPELIAGDAVADLESAVNQLPADAPLVIVSSNTMAHLDADARTSFFDALADLSRRRPLWWVGHEPYESGLSNLAPDRADLAGSGVLSVTHWADGSAEVHVLATTDLRGQRITWRA